MNDQYNDEDIVMRSQYTMVTSRLVDGKIGISIYERIDNGSWDIVDAFTLTLKAFGSINDEMSFLMAKYVREAVK
jgi:hypothetical protein